MKKAAAVAMVNSDKNRLGGVRGIPLLRKGRAEMGTPGSQIFRRLHKNFRLRPWTFPGGRYKITSMISCHSSEESRSIDHGGEFMNSQNNFGSCKRFAWIAVLTERW